MSEAIQIQIKDQGDIVIPAEIRKRLGLIKGMMLVAEDGNAGQLRLQDQQTAPAVVAKQDVLVVTSSPDQDLADVVRQERERRMSSLWPSRAP